jgi:hypothetical protein
MINGGKDGSVDGYTATDLNATFSDTEVEGAIADVIQAFKSLLKKCGALVDPTDGGGTVVTTGTAVVGTSTSFTSDFSVGDFVTITVAANTYEVREITEITDDTHMTLNKALTADVSGVAYEIGARVTPCFVG